MTNKEKITKLLEDYIKENKKDFTMTRVGEKIDLKKINDDEL